MVTHLLVGVDGSNIAHGSWEVQRLDPCTTDSLEENGAWLFRTEATHMTTVDDISNLL